MEMSNSTMLVSSEEETILMQTVEAMVNKSPDNGSEISEVNTYYLVTDVQEREDSRIATSSSTSSNFNSNTNVPWAQMCRLCASVNEHLIPIFHDEGAEHKLCDKIHKYLPIHISETDGLPLQLCYHCAATVLAWNELSDGCLNAQNQLLQMQAEYQSKQQCNSSSEINDTIVTKLPSITENCIVVNETHSEHNENPKESTTEKGDEAEENTFDRCSKQTFPTTALTELRKAYKFFLHAYIRSCIKFPKTTLSNCKLNQTKSAPQKALTKINDKSNGSSNFDRKISAKKLQSAMKMYIECEYCRKKFKSNDNYKSHVKNHSGEMHFTCHICGKQFKQTGSLYYHLKHVHDGIKNHACDICGRTFAMKTTMEDHRRIHTGERPYVCDSCGKTFKAKASLYIHRKIHSDEFPFKCSYCKKAFRWKQQMLGHETIHTGEKNHSCDICGKAFGVKNDLTRHKRIHSQDKPFTCEICGINFGQKRYLKRHERTKHK